MGKLFKKDGFVYEGLEYTTLLTSDGLYSSAKEKRELAKSLLAEAKRLEAKSDKVKKLEDGE